MTRRRVLIIVENLPVPLDTRVWNEATTLAAHGYEVSVICPVAAGFERRFEMIDGIFVHRHPVTADTGRKLGYVAEYANASYWQLRLALRILRERGFDVIHACNPPDTLFALGLFFKLFGKRFIFDHHDLAPELYQVKFGRRDFIYRLLLCLERWTFRTADVVISTNESFRRIAIERGGIDPDRVRVVRSGPNPQRMQAVLPNTSLRRGRKYLVGYVGLMAQQDGIDHLLDAVDHIVHALGRSDIQFFLAGNGPELDNLRERSTALGIAEYVTFAGWLGVEDLVEMLSTADVCVGPDDVNEMNDKCTMNKIMEYMALGKPIVQFETTEGRFSAQGASVYARPNDVRDFAAKIVELLGDSERRNAMGEIGRERVRSELAWSHQVPKLLAAYDAAFETSSRVVAPENGTPPAAYEEIEISAKGSLKKVPCLRAGGRTVVLSGKWLKIARIHDEEWLTPLSPQDPESLVSALRKASPRPDIFTFARGVSATEIRHHYHFEWEDSATIAITTYSDWWTGLPRIGRKNVRRAQRRAVVVQPAAFDDALIGGIKELYDETPNRQGRRFWHFGKDLESVKRDNATYPENSEFLGAYHDRRLIGFLKLVYVDRVAHIMQILASTRHSDKRPSNALLAKAVEVCCQRGMTHLIYGRYSYGNKGDTPLTQFKCRNGFARVAFPRYFVPLTRKGELAIALKLHLGLTDLLPRRLMQSLLSVRSRFYSPQLAHPDSTKSTHAKQPRLGTPGADERDRQAAQLAGDRTTNP